MRPEPNVVSVAGSQSLNDKATRPTTIRTVNRICVERIAYSFRTNSIFCCGVTGGRVQPDVGELQAPWPLSTR